MRFSAFLSMASIMGCAVFGQEPSRQIAFEAASVKLATPREDTGGPKSTGAPPAIARDAGRINFSNVSLKGVMCRAYDLRPDRIVGPSWLDTERYDIVATVPKDSPAGQIPAMLQDLLAKRFRMSVHWAEKQASGYALVVGKSGPKLTKSTLEDSDGRSMGVDGLGHLTWTGEALDGVARSLSMLLDKPVVDNTGIPGAFDITLDVAPDSLPGLPSRSPSQESASLPSIFTAIRGLGLELQPSQVTIKQLVVDSAQKIPTPN